MMSGQLVRYHLTSLMQGSIVHDLVMLNSAEFSALSATYYVGGIIIGKIYIDISL
jgi:hypothetical protein